MMYTAKPAWRPSLVAVLILVAGTASAEEMPPLPRPLTGRTPLAVEGTTVELSRPLTIPTTNWLDPDEVSLPEAPRVAALAPPAQPPASQSKAPAKTPPEGRTAHRSVLKGSDIPRGSLPELRSADASDIAGAFAAPGKATAPPKAETEEPEITPIEEDEIDVEVPSDKGDSKGEDDVPTQSSDLEHENTNNAATETEPQPLPFTPPAKPLVPLTRNQIYLRTKLRKVLAYYYARPLNSQEHDCWEVMHGMLAYELHSKVRDGNPRAEPITAIGHLCYNRACQRKQMLRLNSDGEIDARVGVGVQGHKGQFLAMLAQCNVTPDYPMIVDGKELTIRDLIKSEQRSCEAKSELTFKLIGLMHYLPSDTTWVDNRGTTWDIPRLIHEELAQPIRGAACGGTHRLSGLTLAARKRVARGEPLDGDWLKAHEFVAKYQNYAYRLQNRDGSLSTEWFRGPGYEDDIDRRVKTTGHTLEWLLYAASDDQLQLAPTLRAVNYLTNLLYSNSSHQWEVGPLSHALHALVVYDKRVFQPHDGLPEEVASSAAPNATQPKSTAPSRRTTTNSARRSAMSRSR